MKIRRLIPTLLVPGASAVAIALAPLAAAAPTGPVCTSTGNATQCQTQGNAQITATPPYVDYGAQYPFFGGYGLIFHHGGGR